MASLRRCHGLAPWSFTLAATTATALLRMPRACPVEPHAVSYCSGDREAPRDKPVASRNRAALCSGEREAPRDKPVASRAVWLHLFLKDHKSAPLLRRRRS